MGSSLAVDKGGFDVSPATMRNEMQELEELGYLSQFHTSGGRIPTDKAYRYFVNNIVAKDDLEPTESERERLRSTINSTHDPYQLNKGIAKTLSDLSDTVVFAKVLNEPDFFKIGLTSLFESPEFRTFDKAFGIADLFEHFDTMFERIEREFFSQPARTFEVFIGHENPLGRVRDETMITAKYSLPDNLQGSLTMVGPKRMNYGKNIGLVKYVINELDNKVKNT